MSEVQKRCWLRRSEWIRVAALLLANPRMMLAERNFRLRRDGTSGGCIGVDSEGARQR